MVCRLSEMNIGSGGIVREVDETGAKMHFLEMGCVPGAPLSLEYIAPLGDPIAIRIAGYCLTMRKKDAEHIWVKVDDEVK